MSEVEQLQTKLDALENDIEQIDYFRKYALTYLRVYPEKVRATLDEVLQIGKRINSSKVIAEALTYLGWCDHDMSLCEQSIQKFEEAKSLFESIKDQHGIMRACNGLILGYMEIGAFNEAIENSIQGVELAEKLHDKRMILILLLNISMGYIELERYDLGWQQVARINELQELMTPQDYMCFSKICIELAYREGDYERVIQECHKRMEKS